MCVSVTEKDRECVRLSVCLSVYLSFCLSMYVNVCVCVRK